MVVLFVPLNGAAPAASPGASAATAVGGSPLLDKPAPAIALQDLDGNRVTLADYIGRPVVVNIWASWCIPCRDEFPRLVGAYGEYRDQGLEILGIVHDDTAPNARAFAQQQGATWPMLLDADRPVWRDYIGIGVPQSYFIDAAGYRACLQPWTLLGCRSRGWPGDYPASRHRPSGSPPGS